MKLGIGSYAYAWSIGVPGHQPDSPMDVFSFVKSAAASGVSLVQISDNLPLHALQPESLQRLIDICGILKVEVEVGTRGLISDKVKKYLDIAFQFESPFLRLVVDDKGFEPEADEIVREIKHLLPILRDRNTVLAIENHDRFRVKQLAQIVEDTDPQWVGICLDTANSLGAGEGIVEAMEHLAPYTVNLHIKDIQIKRVPSNMGFTVIGCPAGEGVIDIPWLLDMLSKNPNFFSATLELWPDFRDDLKQTINTEHLWVQHSIAYIKAVMATVQKHPT